MAGKLTDATDYIAEAITEHWGERCPDFAEGCAYCEAWQQYDRLREVERRAKEAINGVIGEWSPIEDLLFGDFPDTKSITITAPLGAFRRARALSEREGQE